MTNQSRVRGIVASRSKLEMTMLNAGIKTQAALAEKIAEIEKISTPPKDTVNRAFRQEKISPSTLARIANVLNVAPEELYLTSEENNSFHTTQSVDQVKRSLSRPFLWVFLIVVILLSAWWLFHYLKSSSEIGSPKNSFSSEPRLGRYGLLIYVNSGSLKPLALPLKKILKDKIDAAIVDKSAGTSNIMSVDLIKKYQSDAVLTLHATQIGSFIGIQVFIYYQGLEKLIWTDSVDAAELEQQKTVIIQDLKPVIYAFFNLNESNEQQQFQFADIQAQENYLNARKLLQDQNSEMNIRRAQSLLDSAISRFPIYARAYAAKCESFVSESWNGNEKLLLEKAMDACLRAMELAPDDLYVNLTLADAFRRSGRIEKAIELYQNLLESWPHNAAVLSGLGVAYLAAFRHQRTAYPEALKKAENYLSQAVKLDPKNWHHQSDLGTVKYFSGNIKGAIVNFEASAELHPNELSYVNVGTLNFCLGDVEKAKSLYQKVVDIAPQSHRGYEFLGTTAYFLGNFEQSAKLRQKAINLLNVEGGTQKMWGNLADSYYLINNKNEARKDYQKALTIIERDELRGNLTTTEKIHRYYYRLMLNKLDNANRQLQYVENRDYHFTDYINMDLENSAYITLAKIEKMLNHKSNARQALAKSVALCPVFASHPTLKDLL
ncbi:MAG TPA: tetratricopeptide repeat protein [Aeromonadales bacterium]|nr:tetratricopeptide repeat protein [Aeromonadales bacterium]